MIPCNATALLFSTEYAGYKKQYKEYYEIDIDHAEDILLAQWLVEQCAQISKKKDAIKTESQQNEKTWKPKAKYLVLSI